MTEVLEGALGVEVAARPSPIRVALADPVIADRGRALIVRERYLAPLESERRPIVVDLNSVHVLTAPAADELLVRWLERARSPRNPLVVAFGTFVQDVRETTAAALFQGRQAAYLINSLPREGWPLHEKPVIAGDASPAQLETVDALFSLPGSAGTARQVAARLSETGKEITPTAATNRLNECVASGLLLRVAQSRRTGDSFVYPWHVELPSNGLTRPTNGLPSNGKPADTHPTR